MPAHPQESTRSAAMDWALVLLQPARTMREAGLRESWERLPAYGLWWGLLMTLALLLPPGLRGQLHWRMAPPVGWFLTCCLIISLATVSAALLAGALSLAARIARSSLPLKTALVIAAWSAAPAPIVLALLSLLILPERVAFRTGGALLSQTTGPALPILLAGAGYGGVLIWMGLRGAGASWGQVALVLAGLAALAALGAEASGLRG